MPATDTQRWAAAAREAAGAVAQLASRLEHDGPGPLSATADLLARSGQLYTGDRVVLRDGPVRDLRGIAGVAGQGRRPSGAEIAPLLDGLSGTVRQVAGAHTARGEALQARHLERAAGDVAAMAATWAAVPRMIPNDQFVSRLIGDKIDYSPTLDEDEERRRHGHDGRDRDRGFGR